MPDLVVHLPSLERRPLRAGPAPWRPIIDKAIAYAEECGFASYDLFDALRSPAIDRATRGLPLARRVAIQLLRRIPFNIRPLLGIRPMVHTKTVSDLLSAYSFEITFNGRADRVEHARRMYRELLTLAFEEADSIGWGLNFPYTTRFVDAGASTPNLFNTVNAANACLDYYTATGDEHVFGTVKGIVRFITMTLGVVADNPETAWIRYYPGQRFPIANVNASVGALLLRMRSLFPSVVEDPSIAARIIRGVCATQNPDGSWFYAQSPNGRWVDGFHSGYVLEALIQARTLATGSVPEDVIERGVDFFIDNLFLPGGMPRVFHNGPGMLEAQNSAQAIQTLALIGLSGVRECRALMKLVIQHTLDGLYDPRGFFYYRRGRMLTIKQPYLRWSQTPMVLALLWASHHGA